MPVLGMDQHVNPQGCGYSHLRRRLLQSSQENDMNIMDNMHNKYRYQLKLTELHGKNQIYTIYACLCP